MQFHFLLIIELNGVVLKEEQPYVCFFFFNVLLTVHLSIFILVVNQLDAQNLFYNNLISCLYMFRTPCAHCQEVKNSIIQPLIPEAV